MAYFGSKTASGVRELVVAAMPPHDVYIETHLGSGAVMLAKPPAARSIAIDLDRLAVGAFARVCGDTLAGQRVDLYAGDAVDYLDGLDWPSLGRVLIYADPPYVLATRSSARRYHHDMTDADHRRLIECLRRVPAAVILSGYPSALYDELLADWRVVEFQVMTRGGPRTERLWLNFPAGAVQWSTFAGRGFTDRQRIKRKAARWAAMFAACPPGERLAILAALLATGETPASMVDCARSARPSPQRRPQAALSPSLPAEGGLIRDPP